MKVFFKIARPSHLPIFNKKFPFQLLKRHLFAYEEVSIDMYIETIKCTYFAHWFSIGLKLWQEQEQELEKHKATETPKIILVEV